MQILFQKTKIITIIGIIFLSAFQIQCGGGTKPIEDTPSQNKSSNLSAEEQYDCVMTDAEQDGDSENLINTAGWLELKIAAPASDMAAGQKYEMYSIVENSQQNKIALIEPEVIIPKGDREYIVFLSAGHQGVGAGFPASMTGQKDKWKQTFNEGGTSIVSTCKASIFARIQKETEGYTFPGESQITKRFPPERTYFTGAFNSRFSFVDGNGYENVAAAHIAYIKSLGYPEKIKGIYLGGSSMGGCLAYLIASALKQDEDWYRVPIILQPMDPVCPNGFTGTDPVMGLKNMSNIGSQTPENSMYENPESPSGFPGSFSFLGNDNFWLSYKPNSINEFDAHFQWNSATCSDAGYTWSGTSCDTSVSIQNPNEWLQDDTLRIYHIVAGGKVTGNIFCSVAEGCDKARAFSRNSDNRYKNSIGDGHKNLNKVWYRQKWMHECHGCIGRNWHHWIMDEGLYNTDGSPDESALSVMAFMRMSYNELNMWGHPVWFAAASQNGPTSYLGNEAGTAGTVPNLLATNMFGSGVIAVAELGANRMVTITINIGDSGHSNHRTIQVPIEVSDLSGTGYGATYGDDYFFSDVNGDEIFPDYDPATDKYYVHAAPYAKFTKLYIKIVNDSIIESEEIIALRIGDYPVLGRPTAELRYFRVRIIDFDTPPMTQSTCLSLGGTWTYVNSTVGYMCSFTAVAGIANLNDDSCGSVSGKYDSVGRKCNFQERDYNGNAAFGMSPVRAALTAQDACITNSGRFDAKLQTCDYTSKNNALNGRLWNGSAFITSPLAAGCSNSSGSWSLSGCSCPEGYEFSEAVGQCVPL